MAQSEIIAKIQDFLSKHKNDYYEIEVVRNLKENQEALQKVVDLYDKAVIEGIKTQNARQAVKEQKNNTAENVGVNSTGIQFSQRVEDYPYNMQTVIKQYLDSYDLKFIDFIEDARAETNKKKT